jgi:hypothetical protein
MGVVISRSGWAPVKADGLGVVEPVTEFAVCAEERITVGTVVSTGSTATINEDLVVGALACGGMVVITVADAKTGCGAWSTGIEGVELVIVAVVAVAPILVIGVNELVAIFTLNTGVLVIILGADETAGVLALCKLAVVCLSYVVIFACTTARVCVFIDALSMAEARNTLVGLWAVAGLAVFMTCILLTCRVACAAVGAGVVAFSAFRSVEVLFGRAHAWADASGDAPCAVGGVAALVKVEGAVFETVDETDKVVAGSAV